MTGNQPKTPPRAASKNPLINSTPIGPSVSGTGSFANTLESVGRSFKDEWARNSALDADFRGMLNILFTQPPPENENFKKAVRKLKDPLSEALSHTLEVERYQPFADVANQILENWYDKSPIEEENPKIVFVALGNQIAKGHASRKPDMVIFWRDQILNFLDNAAENIEGPISNFISASLDKLGTKFPWHLVIGVLEFKSETQQVSRKRNSSEAGIGSNNSYSSKRIKRAKASDKVTSPQYSRTNTGTIEDQTTKSPSTAVVQLLNYLAEMMSSSIYREWVFGAIIKGGQLYLISCDREGGILSKPIDTSKDDDFGLFVDWITRIAASTAVQLGYSSLFGEPAMEPNAEKVFTLGSSREGDEPLKLQVGETIHQQYGLFGRGTIVFKSTFKQDGKNQSGVCKVSWQPKTRAKEWELIKAARQINQRNTPEVMAFHTWDLPPPSRKLEPLSSRKKPFEHREIRVMVMPQYQPLYELTHKNFLEAFKEIMHCDVQLYNAKNVHHRDLSIMNMMYHQVDDKYIGILTDFDHAVLLSAESNSPSSERRSGTAPFMAMRLQQKSPPLQILDHDFESALYILLWVACGYKGWEPPPKKDPLQKWRRNTWEDISSAKSAFILGVNRPGKPWQADIIEEYFLLRQPIQKLATEVGRRMLFREEENWPPEEFFKCLDSCDQPI